ncbi:SH3 domain-containing protein [Tessaracoccus palaemonis]|uniref:SH3 domain-containing protein n=1 Tax=Tessaracoccus palaemonis TaxID=2829499 RepID=A0ABX8SN07_9ACTN|nr:SH3 domain-containing protein [Tessaracoccus palaemonis]QXT62564.1 SH3 domain-containing protein [Tessaracoccus palaemonis]
MAGARRAARDDDIVEVSTADHAATPRRGSGRAGGASLRLVLAPLAVATVTALVGGLMTLPADGETVDRTDPVRVAAFSGPLGTSRSLPRTALESPSPSPAAAEAAQKSSPSAEPSATAEKKAEKVDKKTKEKAPDYDELADTARTLYAEAAVNVRTGPGTDYDSVGTLGTGEDVKSTQWKVDGWRQVKFDGEAGWIKASFLTADEPAESGFSTATCAKANGLEANLTTAADGVLRAVCARFPAVTSFGGYRAGDSGYHGSGQAIDAMISGSAGWEIAEWARDNAGELGIVEVIYQQKIWTTQRAADGWRSMSDRGSTSANHYDHVHISIGS